jgi:hypothetical protein
MNLPVEPYEECLWQGSDRLYIGFTGINGGLGLPQNDFLGSAGIIDHSHIIVRDPYPAWYQRGVPQVGDDVRAIAQRLRQRIDQLGVQDVRFIGNSMGGFAALLFCSLVGRGRAIAIVPQCYLSAHKVAQTGDARASELLQSLYDSPDQSRFIYDLKDHFAQHSPNIRADLHFCTSHAEDMTHAETLQGFRNIRIHTYPRGGHRLMVYLKEWGLLPKIFG